MAFAVLVAVGIAGSGLALFLAIRKLIDGLSGWSHLAACYRAPQSPAAWQWERRTIRVGAVRYRRCIRLAAQPEGLYIEEAGLPGHAILCIPWSDLRNPMPSRFYGRPSVRLQAGPGTIELPVELYESVFHPAAQVR